MSFTTVKLPKTLVDLVKELIKEYPELNYNTVQEFVKDAVRCRIIEIRKSFREETKRKDSEVHVQVISENKIDVIENIIKELENLTKWGAPEEKIFEWAEKSGIDKEETKEIIEKLKKMGNVFSLRYGHYKAVE